MLGDSLERFAAFVGPENMHIIEDGFMYRLVWALETQKSNPVNLG